jgi:hypothetical protein
MTVRIEHPPRYPLLPSSAEDIAAAPQGTEYQAQISTIERTKLRETFLSTIFVIGRFAPQSK